MKTKELKKGKAYAHNTMHSMESFSNKVVMVDPTRQYAVARYCSDTSYITKGDHPVPASVTRYDRVLVRDGHAKNLRAVRPRDIHELWSVHQKKLKDRRDRDAAAQKTRAAREKTEAAQYRKIKRALKALGYDEDEDFHEDEKWGHTHVFFSLEAVNCLLGIKSGAGTS